MSKVYQHRSVVTIGDVDLLQGMYYINQLKLEAVTRERWMMECVPNYLDDIKRGLVVVTRDTECRFFKVFRANDHIEVQLQFVELKRSSMVLRFMHLNEHSREVHAQGTQTVAFLDNNGKIARMPEKWRAAIAEYLVQPQDEQINHRLGSMSNAGSRKI